MHTASGVSHELARLGEVCGEMGSLFFARLLERAAGAYQRDDVLRTLLDRHARRSRIGLRLGGAAHFRALLGDARAAAAHYPSTGGDGDADAAWDAVLEDIRAHAAVYDDLLAREVQTNEVARSMPVLGAMLAVAANSAMPLRIFEIGSSAGLLLNFDRYHYAGDGWSWGDPGSKLHLRNRTASGTPAHLDADLVVAERRGCDLHPLNPAEPADAARLLCFVWPDQAERLERLRAAIEVAREHPPDVTAGDGVAWSETAAAPQSGAATVLLHTVVTEHMTDETRASLRERVGLLALQARQAAPFAWARMEPGERGYEMLVTMWPSNVDIAIAASDGHAQNLRWRA